MNQIERSPCPSEQVTIDRVFVEATRYSIDHCKTLAELEVLGKRLAADRIATAEEKRLVRADYARMRLWLMQQETYDCGTTDKSGHILRKRSG